MLPDSVPPFASNHRDVMVMLAQQRGWRRGVELGIGKGFLFGRFLSECPDLTMIGVDTFLRPERKARAYGVAERFPDRATLYERTTANAAALVADGSVDFVFIDAGHSYQAVLTDIQRWRSKVRVGGWLGGHDYCEKFPGVKRAVHEIFGDHVDLLPATIWAAR